MTDRTEELIREVFADQAARAVDSREVIDTLRGRPARRYGLVVATAAVVVVVAAVAAFVVPEVFRRSEPLSPAASGQQQTTPVSKPVNVLVVGVDSHDNTDTIALVHIGSEGVDVASIPRDTWNGTTKLNQLYVRDGMPALVDAVTDLTGIRPEHHVVVDMSALPSVADAVGGVPVCLLAASEDDYAEADFPQGEQVLTGASALAFVRQRHGLPNGDLDRIARQQAFLRGLATKLPSADLPALLDAVADSIQTDSGFDLLGAVQMLAQAPSLHIGTIPTGTLDFQTPLGSAIEVDPAQVKEFVAGLPGTPPSDGVPCVN